jgi:hypothetical protein
MAEIASYAKLDMNHKTVNLPITVPTGDLCWDGHNRICEHFDNEGGGYKCELGLGWPENDRDTGYPSKCEKCKNLKSI